MTEPINYENLSEAELDALFAKGEGFASEPTPEPVAPEPTPEPEPTPVEPEPSAEPITEPEPEPAVEPVDEEAKIKQEQFEAKLRLQEAHASRMAGEIGFLREQLKSRPLPSEPYEPQSEADIDRLTQLERRFQESEAHRTQIEVAQAVESAVNALDVAEVIQSIQAEITAVAPKYAEQLNAARQVSDPVLARQLADAVCRSVIADAKEMAWTNRRKSLEEKKAVQARELTARKKSATVSGGGAVSATRPAAKPYDEMTPSELDAEMDKEFGVFGTR